MDAKPGTGDLQRAMAAHQTGQLAAAEAAYRRILTKTPDDVQTLHMLGLLCGQSGRLPEGIALIERALKSDPAIAQAHYGLASLQLKAGESAAAERGFRRAGELAPDFAGAHFALASLLQKQERRDEAIAAYRAGLTAAPETVAALNNLSGLLREAGRLEEAENCLAEALRIAPNYAEGHYAWGQLRAHREDWTGALEAYRHCLSLKPNWPPALLSMAGVLQHMGATDEALGCLQETLRAAPRDTRARHALARLHWQQGNLDDAARCLQQLLEQEPENLSGLSDLAEVALARGDADVLLACHSRILGLAPEDPARWRVFVGAIRHLRIDGFDPRLCDLFLAALARDDLDHQDLAVPAVSLLKAAPSIAALLGLAPAASEVARDAAARSAMAEPLLCALLARVLIPDFELEAALTLLRQRLLAIALAMPPQEIAPQVLRFGQALAQQCFLNEYLYDESESETAMVARLTATLTTAQGPWDARQGLGLALLAAYRPLQACQGLDDFWARARAGGDAAVADLLKRQLDEPREEAEIAAEIASLGSITNQVSQAVRAQYEENPYPRWQSLSRFSAGPLRKILPEVCPALAGVTPLPPERPRVLVAGCGTGRHALLAAQLYQASALVAVDLSRASLAYAIRKAKAIGIDSIAFYQADILELPAHLAPFDVIESSGVLHHMASPQAGWQALAQLLKPGGLMKIALYSDAARQHIVAARDLIAARGFAATGDGIRLCRREIFARRDDPVMAKLAAGRDFYSMSLCRDLIFHVQEHRFSLPEIGAACHRLGLTFLGIEPQEPRLAESYRVRFPEDPRLTSLDNWARFETENPDCFAEMIHFWLMKPADAAVGK